MSPTSLRISAATYIIVAVLTFGWSFHRIEIPEHAIKNEGIIRPTTGLLCGILWPLYWTVKAFEPSEEA